MENMVAIDPMLIRPWIQAELKPDGAEAKLQGEGFSEENVMAYLREFKKERFADRPFKGFICMALGAFLGFISCLLTVFNPIPELYNIILFVFFVELNELGRLTSKSYVNEVICNMSAARLVALNVPQMCLYQCYKRCPPLAQRYARSLRLV
ncbi:MAG: hypothetical protein IT249_13800 [Chitinophagaceae bacterium]|nr:hypothetical protein [Chitinophagaceae bacterium]